MDNNDKNICPICGTEYSKKERECPNCAYRKPMDMNKTLWIFIILLLPFTSIRIIQENIHLDIFNNPNSKGIKQKLNENEENIKIRPMTELSGLTKEEIFNKRKEYVRKSIVFSDIKNYSPSNEVYKIEDKLPWISAYEIAKNGAKNNKNIGRGASRHSISVNNPELLFTFVIPNFGDYRKNKSEFTKADYLLPTKLVYDKENKVLRANYAIADFLFKNPYLNETSMFLDETNARDMGYNYAYVEDFDGIIFINTLNNFSKNVYKMLGYYHKGASCNLEGGCNNYSPYQEEMVFKVGTLDARMKIKLWKNKPISKDDKADFIYEMILK